MALNTNQRVESFLSLLKNHLNLTNPKLLILYDDSYVSIDTVSTWDIEEKKDFLMKFFLRYSESFNKPIFHHVEVKNQNEKSRIDIVILVSKTDLLVYQKLHDYFNFCEV